MDSCLYYDSPNKSNGDESICLDSSMKLFSLIEQHNKYQPITVELELWPGLPDIAFIGCPDQHLKESAKRIKSAIRAQGFEFNQNQQVLVNLKPSYLKKSSRGLELAVALAYLCATKQINLPSDEALFIYGELSLNGEISVPDDFLLKFYLPNKKLISGHSTQPFRVPCYQAQCLADFRQTLELNPAQKLDLKWTPSAEILSLQIPKPWGRLLGACALGTHSVLLAGSSGAGKTTAGRILHALLPPPSPEEQDLLLENYEPLNSSQQIWRPLIQPHHTIPLNSLIGGGSVAHGGELARSNLGLILLDEFFEYSPHVMEALREPMESKTLRISRGTNVKTYPLNTQFIATTNLCPCGDWVPGVGHKTYCRFSLNKCRSYSQKITGPLLDRFEVLFLVAPQQPFLADSHPKVDVQAIRSHLEVVRRKYQPLNRSYPLLPLPLIQNDPLFKNLSRRRLAACLRLAQSLAQWDQQESVSPHCLEEAYQYTQRVFQAMKQWDLG